MDNNHKNKYDSIIFDLDGTLWDSSANVALAWQTAISKVDYLNVEITQERIRSVTGMTYEAIFDTLFPDLNDEQRNHVQELCAVSEMEILHTRGGKLYPQLEKTLQNLATKYKLFIVSNCQNGYIELFLDLNGLHQYFQGHQCFGTKGKPKSDNITDVINDYHLKAPVYIGDTLGDYDASTKAGVPFIFANYGFGIVNQGMVATISEIADLEEIL